ncbi:hypothetical protein ABMY26_05255 [Azospirillum sp. HJ39]|uniref:hypothetical protein n=1 Tax=Azospirillum sp. HJ39 TaxID=3159496 RepID=UPI003557A3CB
MERVASVIRPLNRCHSIRDAFDVGDLTALRLRVRRSTQRPAESWDVSPNEREKP